MKRRLNSWYDIIVEDIQCVINKTLGHIGYCVTGSSILLYLFFFFSIFRLVYSTCEFPPKSNYWQKSESVNLWVTAKINLLAEVGIRELVNCHLSPSVHVQEGFEDIIYIIITRKVSRHQRGNQKPEIEGHTVQWLKEKKTNIQICQNTTQLCKEWEH